MNVQYKTNEFVLRFANINGTGSASANTMVAKSFFRMGLPIGPKNMFPSNIQGLPTWYEVRVSERGYTGRRGGVDLVVAMNPQTFAADVASLSPGGFLVYDSARTIFPEDRRKDLTYLGIPFTELALREFENPKSRIMLKNIVYVGALVALLDIDYAVVEELLRESYAKKPKLLEDNFRALAVGFQYTREHFQCPLPLRVERRDLVGQRILLEGNDACGLGAVYAGATVAAWYPITPSTSLVDAFAKYCHKFRMEPDTGKKKFAILQAEDELSAAGMVLGANWNGARAFTATSGPGISLMTEFIGFAYYAEIPAVFFNVQRTGPSTGMPTRTQQADILACAYASHGDTKHIMLLPANSKECFEFSVKSFDLAERFQTPVFVMSDLELGMNPWLVEPLEWDDGFQPDRGKVMSFEDLEKSDKPFHRYFDYDDDGVPYRTLPGTHPTKGGGLTRGSGHDKFGRYTEDPVLYKENVDRLVKKFNTAASYVPKPVERIRDQNAKVGILAFGTTEEPLREALDHLETQGIRLNDIRVRAFPFTPEVKAFLQRHERVIVVEQNRDAQFKSLLCHELQWDPNCLSSLLCYDGLPATANDLAEGIKSRIGGQVK